MMPEKDGIEILTALKKDKVMKNIPVIMLTTKNMLNEVNRLFTSGADDYICKPFNVDIIGKQIRDKLEKYKQRKGINN
jgi:DNA-binding response OmpR family regulator